MNRLVKIACGVLTIAMLAGCGEPTLDMTNSKTQEASVEKVMESLSKEQQVEFQKALTSLYMKATMGSVMGAFSGNAKNSESLDKLNEQLDGKTAEEVIEFAKESRGK